MKELVIDEVQSLNYQRRPLIAAMFRPSRLFSIGTYRASLWRPLIAAQTSTPSTSYIYSLYGREQVTMENENTERFQVGFDEAYQALPHTAKDAEYLEGRKAGSEARLREQAEGGYWDRRFGRAAVEAYLKEAV